MRFLIGIALFALGLYVMPHFVFAIIGGLILLGWGFRLLGGWNSTLQRLEAEQTRRSSQPSASAIGGSRAHEVKQQPQAQSKAERSSSAAPLTPPERLAEGMRLLGHLLTPDDQDVVPGGICSNSSCTARGDWIETTMECCPACGASLNAATVEEQVEWNRQTRESFRQRIVSLGEVDWPTPFAYCADCHEGFPPHYRNCPHCSSELVPLSSAEIEQLLQPPSTQHTGAAPP